MVHFRVEADPRHIRARVVRCTPNIARIGGVRQPVDTAIFAHLRHAETKVHIRCIDVGEALQRNAIQTGLAGRHDARPAESDRDIGRQRALKQEAIRERRLGAVGIDHRHIVESQLFIAQVEGRDDLRRIDHLEEYRLDFLAPRAHQLQ